MDRLTVGDSKTPRGAAGRVLRAWAAASILLALLSCGMGVSSSLKKRVDAYYTAWKFKDYSSMYYFLNDWGQEQFSEESFVQFLSALDTGKEIYRPGDLEADYLRDMKPGGSELFKIEEVHIQNGRGKVRLFLKTSKDLVGELIVDPKTWILERDEWRIELTERSPLYNSLKRWLAGRAPALAEGSVPAGEAEKQLSRVETARKALSDLAERMGEYVRVEGRFPERLADLPQEDPFRDPFSASGEFRYATDGVSFWIAISDGPDGIQDIDERRFNGFRNRYPPSTLVYDPSTGKGDLYNYGPN
jgi:hypothetical protein